MRYVGKEIFLTSPTGMQVVRHWRRYPIRPSLMISSLSCSQLELVWRIWGHRLPIPMRFPPHNGIETTSFFSIELCRSVAAVSLNRGVRNPPAYSLDVFLADSPEYAYEKCHDDHHDACDRSADEHDQGGGLIEYGRIRFPYRDTGHGPQSIPTWPK